jgi:hypothetical protein
MTGWIVVFDLDDTLVTRQGGPVILEDTLAVLQKAIVKRDIDKSVQYIYLYTYNQSYDYIVNAVDVIQQRVGLDPFDDYVFIEDSREEPFRSKSARRIKEIYDTKHTEPLNEPEDFDSFKKRILFLDDIMHEVLFADIGLEHYALLGSPGDTQRQNEIKKILNILEPLKGGRRKTIRYRTNHRRRTAKN